MKSHICLCAQTKNPGEIVQATAKALRFGLVDQYKDRPTPAAQIELEIRDLIAVAEMLETAGIIDLSSPTARSAIYEKKQKVRHYMEYSKERNILE